ncbi:GGDEF domain-containing protein [Aquamicrobium ahrensii]|uniref:diguanylate cyclase n=1 Tax=Aquamicrobium ahrensii TaxID=469551 RepID=A0ABV2KKH2_9HYPH
MGGASFILAINLFLSGLLAGAFMMIAVHDVRRVPARWLVLSNLLCMTYLVAEFGIPAFENARLPVVLAFSLFLASTITYNFGVARKYDVVLGWTPMLAFFTGATVLLYFAQDLPRHSTARMMAYQLPYAVMQLVAAGIIVKSRQRMELADRLLMAALLGSGVQFAAKPFLAHALGGWGNAPQEYVQTAYAMASQSLGTIFAMAVAVLTLVVLVRDVMSDANARSEIDALSRLFNRSGFMAHAGQALRAAPHTGAPVSLVIADLDHFKQINDGFGHATGDSVIELFAGLLAQGAGQGHVVGRIGGEEFAVLLTGTNLGGARLFAEGVRTAYEMRPIDGLPETRRCTASFGIAEGLPQESLGDLMRRADEALYVAKKEGRNRVRVASATSNLPETGPRAAASQSIFL